MNNPTWFRMKNDLVKNPLIVSLDETDRWRYVGALCIACENMNDLITDDEMAYLLSISEAEWVATKTQLIDRGLFTELNQPPDWDEFLKKSDSSTARVRAYRERKRLESAQKSQSDTDETNETLQRNVTENSGNVSKGSQDINNVSTGLSTDNVDNTAPKGETLQLVSDCKTTEKTETSARNVSKTGGPIYIYNNNNNIYISTLAEIMERSRALVAPKTTLRNKCKPRRGQFHMIEGWGPCEGFLDLYLAAEHCEDTLNRIIQDFVAYWSDDEHNHPETQARWESFLKTQIQMKSKPKAKKPPVDPVPLFRDWAPPAPTTTARAAMQAKDTKTPWPQAFKPFEKSAPTVITEEARRKTQHAQAVSMDSVRARLGLRSNRRTATA